MTSELVKSLLPNGPALIVTVGFLPNMPAETPSILRSLPAGATVVDLDTADPGCALPGSPSGVLMMIARTFTDLRRAASVAGMLPHAQHVVVAVTELSPHLSLPALGPSPDENIGSLRIYWEQNGEWAVEFRATRPIPAGRLIRSTVQSLNGRQSRPPLRVGLAGPGAAHWRPGDCGAVLTTEQGPVDEQNNFLVPDLVVRSVGPDTPRWTDPRIRVVDRPRFDCLSWASISRPGGTEHAPLLAATIGHADAVPPIDEFAVNPMGFLASPTAGAAELVQLGDYWAIRGEGVDRLVIPFTGGITDRDVAKLRQLRAIAIRWGRHTGPVAAVRTIAGLAAAGVPIHAPHVPAWAAGLGSDLIELITTVDPDDLEDDIRREEHSIRLRRAAMRGHSTQAYWNRLAGTLGLPVSPSPKISVLLCTRRHDYIPFALAQIARQRGVEVEVILTLHGIPANLPTVQRAIAGFEHPLTVVEVSRDVTFGEALNRGAAQASGDYLAKWDDDDWYGPEFLADLTMAAHYSGADVVGCLMQQVYLEEINLTIQRPGGESERFSRHISGATLLMNRDTFRAVGGFHPIPRHVDTSFLRVLEAHGGRIYRTHGMNCMVHRRSAGHTWNQPVTSFIRAASRQWRGFKPGVFIEADEIRNAMSKREALGK